MTTLLASNYVTLDGLALTAEHDGGVVYVLEEFDGWGSPGSSMIASQNTRAHGAWAGDGYLQARGISLRGTVIGPTTEAVEDALDDLSAAASLSDVTLEVTEGITVRSCQVRRLGDVLSRRISPTAIEWAVSLLALDPRKVGTALSGTTSLPETSGGLTVPFTVPFTIDAVVVAGQVSLTNPGNIQGRVTLRLDGPLTAPQVVHVNSGRALTFAASLTIAEGSYITVDMERREVLENGTASRNGYVTSREWSGFDPGVNVWAFSASMAETGTLTVNAYPAWM